MVTSTVRTNSIRDGLIRFLAASFAAWLATYAFAFLLARYAMARFWESWATRGGEVAMWTPVVVIAFLSGLIVGILLGFAFRRHALQVAAISAVLQLVVAVVTGGIASSAIIAVGVVLGAYVPKRLSRA